MAPKFDSKPGIQSAQKKGVGAICCTLLCYFYLGKYSRQYETHKCRNFPLAWTDGTVTWYFFKMGDKTVALKRDDFNTFSEDTLRGLFEDSDFCDVTLACSDGKQLMAHKVVLSAGSEFFHNLLKQNKH